MRRIVSVILTALLPLTGAGTVFGEGKVTTGTTGGDFRTNWSYILSPHDRDMFIADVWPTIFFGSERVEEMREKIEKLEWARRAFERLKAEAEIVLKEPPLVPIEKVGWRHCFYSPTTAEHFVFDIRSPNRFYDPWDGRFHEGELQHMAWVLLCHERTLRVMRTLGFLYALTGAERYARWVADGMRRELQMFSRDDLRNPKTGNLFFSPLYDAQVLMLLANAYSLTRESGAYSPTDRRDIEATIFERGVQPLLRHLKKASTHNISSYVAAAVATIGGILNRRDLIEVGLNHDTAGLAASLHRGIRADDEGNIDGFWFEGTMFYHFYALCPIITLYEAARRVGKVNDDIRTRFRKMFEAPLRLADDHLRLPCLGDLGAPKVASLRAYVHLYEYAAGTIDSQPFGAVLRRIYSTGIERCGLTALAFGADELPRGEWKPARHDFLKPSGIAVFRDDDTYLLFRCGRHGAGHDHPDRLNIIIHAKGEVISPDPGTAGYILKKIHGYYRSTFAHNTLFVDDENQRNVGEASLEFHGDASLPYAVGVVSDAYEGVTLQRAVFFDPPLVVVFDRCTSDKQHIFGWIFHAYGSMDFRAEESAGALKLPPLRREGALSFLRDRHVVPAVRRLRVNWRVKEDVWLSGTILADAPFRAVLCRSAGQPIPDNLGTVILRTPGKSRRFYTVLEIHSGFSQVRAVNAPRAGCLEVSLASGETRRYELED